VRIMESARDCGGYESRDDLVIGTIQTIGYIVDTRDGIHYGFNSYSFPHYCVMPVEEEEKEEKTVFDDIFGDMIEEFEGLCIKAQEIVDKYKK